LELITLKTVYVSLTWFGPILARPHCAWHAHRRHLFPPRPGYESSPRQIECRVLIVRTANHDASSLCGGARGIAGEQRRVTARRRLRYRISPVRHPTRAVRRRISPRFAAPRPAADPIDRRRRPPFDQQQRHVLHAGRPRPRRRVPTAMAPPVMRPSSKALFTAHELN